MRQKEALAAENAVLTKLAEKQQRMVTSADDLRHSLGVQLVILFFSVNDAEILANISLYFRLLPKRRYHINRKVFN